MPPGRAPRTTFVLVALVLAGWLAQWITRSFDAAALTAATLRAGRWWEIGTHLFVNAGPSWLAGASLVVLALAGRALERIVGGRALWQIFALAGVSGGLSQMGFDALLGRSVPVTGISSAAMGVLLALACVSPGTPLLPGDRAGGGWRRVHVVHGAFGALAATVAAGTTPPAAGALAGALVGCLYVHVLGFCGPGQGVAGAADGGRAGKGATVSAASSASSASSASWPAGAGAPGSPPKTRSAARRAPQVMAAQATVARNALATPRFTERERRMSAREFIAERVDPILEKISREGVGSLTAGERLLLEKAREKMGIK